MFRGAVRRMLRRMSASRFSLGAVLGINQMLSWGRPSFCRRFSWALLFPIGAGLLLLGGPYAATGFAVMYGMSNGVTTINRGTLPLALFGPEGYARMLGWLAVPVLLAQATAPTITAPLVAALPALDVFLLCGAATAVAALFLPPLRLPAG